MSNTENAPARAEVSGGARPLAITSVALSVLGILTWIASVGLISVPLIVGGLITGHLTLGRIGRARGGDRWLAIAGLVIGYAGAAFIAYTVIALVGFFGAWMLSGSH